MIRPAARSCRNRSWIHTAAAGALCLAGLGLAAHRSDAAIVYWDGDGVGTVDGGAGTWDTSSLRWSSTPDGSTYNAWVNENNDDAVFGGPSGSKTVTLGAPITVKSMTFNVSGYVISGPTVVISSATGTLTIDSTTGPESPSIITAQYDSSIANIVKTGSGLFSTGQGQTAFAGKWTVQGGILSLPNDNRIGVIPTTVVPDAITLDGGAIRSSTANITINANRGITIGAVGGGVNSNNTSLTIAGPVTGNLGGAFEKRGSSALILTNPNNNYDGVTNVLSGRITVRSANALGLTTAGTVVSTGAEVVFDDPANPFTINEPFSLSGVGGTSGGALAILGGTATTFAGPITLDSDTLVFVDGTSTATFTNAAAFSSFGSGLSLGGPAGTGGGGIIDGDISLSIGTLSKSDTGTWRLNGDSEHFGGTVVLAGTLVVNGAISGTSGVEIFGTLAGNGSIETEFFGNVQFYAGSKLSPGDGIGELSIALGTSGTLDMLNAISGPSTAFLLYELGPVAASDRFSLTGGAMNIGFASLEFDDFVFTAATGFGAGTYTLFSTDTFITGTLGTNVSGTIAGLDAELQLADSDTDIVLVVIPEPASGALMLAAGALLGLARRRRIGADPSRRICIEPKQPKLFPYLNR